MNSLRARLLLTALAAALAGAPAAPVSAQPAAAPPGESTALGQTLFEEGRRLMEAKQYAEACPKFEESLRLRPGMGTLLNLALCNEAIGKTATAWAQFKEVMFAAKRDGNEAREAFAKEHVDALEPRLSRIQVDAEPTPGLVIHRDGQELPAAALGTPIPVDPGKHTVEATAPGYSVWSTAIEIGAAGERRTVKVPRLSPLPAPAPPQSGAAAPSDVEGDGGRGARRTAGFVVGGVGLAAVGVGAVLGALAAGQASAAEDDPALCPNKQCTPAGRAEIDAAGGKALAATIGVGVGVAAVGVGAALVLTSGGASRPERATTPSARLVPAIGPRGGGFHIVGAF